MIYALSFYWIVAGIACFMILGGGPFELWLSMLFGGFAIPAMSFVLLVRRLG